MDKGVPPMDLSPYGSLLPAELAQEVVAVAAELGLSHAGDLQELLTGRGTGGHHAAQGRVGEDHVGRDASLVCQILAEAAQPLEERLFLVGLQRVGIGPLSADRAGALPA